MALYQGGVDPLIADVMMPTLDGFTMVKEMRAAGFEQPVLMLTAKTTITDKTTGFTSGADDYLTKPVDLAELKLRVAALLRRAKINSARQITIGQTILNEENFTLTINGHSTTLTKKEFLLLFTLLSYPNKIFTQAQLLDQIWGIDPASTEDTVKTHVSKVRKLLKDSNDVKITTIRGLGYKGEICHD